MRSKPEPAPHVEVVRATDVAKLRPGLVISVSVLVAGKKEIDEPAKRISDMGTIALPLLGTLSVKDVTLDDIIVWLTEAYKTYYVNPQVIVEFVRDNNAEGLSPWGYATVLGRVKNPGRYVIPATQDLTVSGAIQKAGGFSSSANISEIVVSRRTSDGKVETRSVDLKAMGAGGRLDEDLIVNADDVVFVPELKF